MATLTTQRPGKKIGPFGVGILLVGGCIPGYQDTPIPPCFFANDPDPACQSGQGHDGSGSGGDVPTTGTAFPGDGSSAEDSEGQGPGDGTDTGEADVETATGSGGSSSGSVVEPVPEIVDLDLDPDAPKSAGPVTVMVQVENAVEVWMTVDDGGEVALEPVGDDGTEFVGEIAVLGESWNGLHTVSAVARAGELESLPWEAMFTVTAPPAGSEAWKKKSSITPSYGNAVAVDPQGEVYELFTESGNAGARCHVRRRSAQGDIVWPQDTTPLAVGVYCIGEDIKVAPDGTLWVLVNTKTANIWRWQLFNLDADGTVLDGTTEPSDVNETGRGLDVNAAGEVLLCGVRPAIQGQDAWVHLRPPMGDGWTVPWPYKSGQSEFDERTKDCAFIEDRIVIVGEAFGQHDQNQIEYASRGFVAEFGVNGVALHEAVAPASPAWQSGHEAVASDGAGGYVAVGYSCDVQVDPCTPTKGVVTWFSLGASLAWEQPVTATEMIWDVAASPAGGVVVAAEALKKEQGFLVQAWAFGQGQPSWAYQGAPSSLQMATGVALNPYGSVYAGGVYLDGNVFAAGVVKLHPY